MSFSNILSVAAACALGAVALNKRGENYVRALAGAAAIGALTKVALSVVGSTTARQVEDAMGTDLDAADERGDSGEVESVVFVEETFIPPDTIVEEVTTVRI